MGFLSALMAEQTLGNRGALRLGGIGHKPVDSATASQKSPRRPRRVGAASAIQGVARRLL
jgi:hypothetical protein